MPLSPPQTRPLFLCSRKTFGALYQCWASHPRDSNHPSMCGHLVLHHLTSCCLFLYSIHRVHLQWPWNAPEWYPLWWQPGTWRYHHLPVWPWIPAPRTSQNHVCAAKQSLLLAARPPSCIGTGPGEMELTGLEMNVAYLLDRPANDCFFRRTFQELLKWPQALWDNAEILLQTFILLDELKGVISLMYSNWHLSNISCP